MADSNPNSGHTSPYAQGISFAQPAVGELRPTKRPRPPVAPTSPVTASSSPSPSRRGSRDSNNPRNSIDLGQGASSSAGSAQSKKPKPPLSCGECRRLKLKCDRVFPCQSCVKRGCAEICPDGSLISGKGSRFILANTEQLHEKIVSMSDRIRQLEEALEASHLNSGAAPHPLLSPEQLTVKSSIELYSTVYGNPASPSPPITSPRHTSVGLTRPATALSASAAAQDREDIDPGGAELPMPRLEASQTFLASLPEDLVQLSAYFPLSWSPAARVSGIRQRLRGMLPVREDAQGLCDQVVRHALWQHNPDPSESFIPELIQHVFTAPLHALSPPRLATFFMVLAIGCAVDLRQGPQLADAEHYHHLARVAMGDEDSVQGETSTDSVMAMFFMMWYLLVFHDRKESASVAWGIMGVAARVSQSIGLHRDGLRWKFLPEQIERRRALFWELVSFDARLSLALGRPPAFPLHYVDTRRPSFPGTTYPMLFFEWNHHFMTLCLQPVIDLVLGAHTPKYSAVTSLDCTIRDVCIPPFLRLPAIDDPGAPAGLILQRAHVSIGRDILLCQLHRTFYMQALDSPEDFIPQHPYIASITSTVYSVCQMIESLDAVYRKEPALAGRFTYFWSNTLEGAVQLCLLLSRFPSCPFVQFTLPHLETCVSLFKTAGTLCPKAEESFPILEDVVATTRRAVLRRREGIKDDPTDVVSLDMEELAILTGSSELGSAGAPIAVQAEPNADPLAGMHPTLMQVLEQGREQTDLAGSSAVHMQMAALPELSMAQLRDPAMWSGFSFPGVPPQQHQQQQQQQQQQTTSIVEPTQHDGGAGALTPQPLEYAQGLPVPVQEYYMTSSGAQLSSMYNGPPTQWTEMRMDMF